MSSSELACVYSALILHDADLAITADRITTLIKAAKVNCEPIWPSLFARALEGKDVGALICNVGSGAAAGAVAAPTAGGGSGGEGGDETAPAEDKKDDKKDEDSESDDDMGFGLFD